MCGWVGGMLPCRIFYCLYHRAEIALNREGCAISAEVEGLEESEELKPKCPILGFQGLDLYLSWLSIVLQVLLLSWVSPGLGPSFLLLSWQVIRGS